VLDKQHLRFLSEPFKAQGVTRTNSVAPPARWCRRRSPQPAAPANLATLAEFAARSAGVPSSSAAIRISSPRLRAASDPALLARIDAAREIVALVRAGRACHVDIRTEIRAAERRGDHACALELAIDIGRGDVLAALEQEVR
jgi:hypothetical protein